MFESGDAVDGLDKFAPAIALGREHLSACGRQAVVTTSSLSRFFDPAALNPTAFFESIEQRVKRSDIEPQCAFRPVLYQVPNVIAMPRLIFDQRKNQQLGTSLLQLPIEHLRSLIWHSDILLSAISAVNSGFFVHVIRISGLVLHRL